MFSLRWEYFHSHSLQTSPFTMSWQRALVSFDVLELSSYIPMNSQSLWNHFNVKPNHSKNSESILLCKCCSVAVFRQVKIALNSIDRWFILCYSSFKLSSISFILWKISHFSSGKIKFFFVIWLSNVVNHMCNVNIIKVARIWWTLHIEHCILVWNI